MKTSLEAVRSLDISLKKLMFNYNFVKKENELLLQNVSDLKNQLLKTSQLLEKQTKEFSFLKIAKTIEGSSDYKKETKLKINALIREIDSCIVQLNE